MIEREKLSINTCFSLYLYLLVKKVGSDRTYKLHKEYIKLLEGINYNARSFVI
jgi:hypothetical protein